jgi:hypothetical protein
MSAIGKCPWCGGSAAMNQGHDTYKWQWVVCQDRACEAEGPTRDSPEAAINAWNRLATPDPERVTGRVRWEGNVLFLGPLYCGFIRPVGDEWRSSANCGGDGMSKIHPTEASARAALVAAVKEAIGDE